MEDKTKEKSSSDDVKSNTLIKFESVSARQFSTLPAAVDLKRPPSNWLNGQIKIRPNMSNCYKFTSFKMAHDFWHELGDVDVISDSENIKNLLKMPYAHGNSLSYFVHRIGNTLLIDQFDLQKYLMWKSEEDWKWLRAFIYENVVSNMKKGNQKPFAIQHKSQEVIQQKNLLSKFLYHSISDSGETEEKEYIPHQIPQLPLLPQPINEHIVSPTDHQFSRNILWTFEDIRMLIGNDMPIFGNASRPCISLRLRDMKKPINVLTGIDYWLDNLMCNVPEIFLCFHQDGIVQKYEHVKTEDLPYMENSKFSPKVIRNVAQNILSFLKSNATQPGHTYWLFKAKNDDVVKLYDLTNLQEVANTKESQEEDEEKESEETEDPQDTEDENNQNPFTIPVAMLMYTLARNLKYSKDKLSSKQAGNIKQLLDNCLKILPKDKYPQITISSHYILSDIQIQAGMDPANPSRSTLDDDDDDDSDEYGEDEVGSEDEDQDEGDELYSAMQCISDAMKESSNQCRKSKPQPLTLGSIQERSKFALENVISGLQCLQYFDSEPLMAREKKKEKEKIIHEEQNPHLAVPDIPIPLGWNEGMQTNSQMNRPSKSDSELVEEDVKVSSKLLLMKGAPNVKTWNTHLKVLLFEKASLSYACLAEDSYNAGKFGETLYFLEMSILCQDLVAKFVPSMRTQKRCLFGRAGDCFFQITKNLDKVSEYVDQMKTTEDDSDREIVKEVEKDAIEREFFKEPQLDVEKMFEASCGAYEKSLHFTGGSKFEVVRRLGSVYNEYGVHLMHKSERLLTENSNKSGNESSDDSSEDHKETAKKAHMFLSKAITLFEGVKDSVNIIICSLNLGRFFRLLAHINLFDYDGSTTASLHVQKKMYQESFNSYNRALAIIENRKSNPEFWDMVSWEFSTAVFNLAKQMQDNTPAGGNTEEVEREVLEVLMKSLKLCDLETNSSRNILYCFRAGLIHRRLASLYHQQLRRISDDSKKRTTLQICRINYEKSISLLESLKEFKEYFQVQMERIALQEFLAEESQNNTTKIKNYQTALDLFLDCSKMLRQLSHAKTVIDQDETLSLLELFEKRLQHVLKVLTKLSISSKKNDNSKSETYKKMFAFTLRTAEKLEFLKLINHLLVVLGNIQKCE